MTVKIHFMIVYCMHNAIPFFRVCKLCARSFVLDSVGSVDAVWCLNSRKRRDEKNITKWHVCFAFIHRIYSISRCELGFVCFSLNAKEWTMNETIHEMLSFCMFQISFLLSRALSWVFQRRHLRSVISRRHCCHYHHHLLSSHLLRRTLELHGKMKSICFDCWWLIAAWRCRRQHRCYIDCSRWYERSFSMKIIYVHILFT